MLEILDPQIFQSANNLTILNCYLYKVFTAGNSEMLTFKGVNALKIIIHQAPPVPPPHQSEPPWLRSELPWLQGKSLCLEGEPQWLQSEPQLLRGEPPQLKFEAPLLTPGWDSTTGVWAARILEWFPTGPGWASMALVRWACTSTKEWASTTAMRLSTVQLKASIGWALWLPGEPQRLRDELYNSKVSLRNSWVSIEQV
jgi:hypothetical protein